MAKEEIKEKIEYFKPFFGYITKQPAIDDGRYHKLKETGWKDFKPTYRESELIVIDTQTGLILTPKTSKEIIKKQVNLECSRPGTRIHHRWKKYRDKNGKKHKLKVRDWKFNNYWNQYYFGKDKQSSVKLIRGSRKQLVSIISDQMKEHHGLTNLCCGDSFFKDKAPPISFFTENNNYFKIEIRQAYSELFMPGISIQGKIDGVSDIKEYRDIKQIGFKVDGIWYSIKGTEEQLKEVSQILEKDNKVKFKVRGNFIKNLKLLTETEKSWFVKRYFEKIANYFREKRKRNKELKEQMPEELQKRDPFIWRFIDFCWPFFNGEKVKELKERRRARKRIKLERILGNEEIILEQEQPFDFYVRARIVLKNGDTNKEKIEDIQNYFSFLKDECEILQDTKSQINKFTILNYVMEPKIDENLESENHMGYSLIENMINEVCEENIRGRPVLSSSKNYLKRKYRKMYRGGKSFKSKRRCKRFRNMLKEKYKARIHNKLIKQAIGNGKDFKILNNNPKTPIIFEDNDKTVYIDFIEGGESLSILQKSTIGENLDYEYNVSQEDEKEYVNRLKREGIGCLSEKVFAVGDEETLKEDFKNLGLFVSTFYNENNLDNY